jgi:hypothetical protein
MILSKMKKTLVAAALGAGVTATAVPAQAGSLQRGLLAGLIGGVALSALAASAQAQQQGGAAFVTLPPDLGAPVYDDDFRTEVRPLRQRQTLRSVPRCLRRGHVSLVPST